MVRDSFSATMRPIRSAEPPGGYGTTTVIGLLGNVSAAAGAASAAQASAANIRA